MGKGVAVDQEQQRDHQEESQAHPDAGEANGPDDRMVVTLRKWSSDANEFEPFETWTVLEPWADRSATEWFEIVTTHIPRAVSLLPVGIYAFTLTLPFDVIAARLKAQPAGEGVVTRKVVAFGEFGWDGRVATRREGATAP